MGDENEMTYNANEVTVGGIVSLFEGVDSEDTAVKRLAQIYTSREILPELYPSNTAFVEDAISKSDTMASHMLEDYGKGVEYDGGSITIKI